MATKALDTTLDLPTRIRADGQNDGAPNLYLGDVTPRQYASATKATLILPEGDSTYLPHLFLRLLGPSTTTGAESTLAMLALTTADSCRALARLLEDAAGYLDGQTSQRGGSRKREDALTAKPDEKKE